MLTDPERLNRGIFARWATAVLEAALGEAAAALKNPEQGAATYGK